MRFFYSMVFLLGTPFVVLLLLLRSIKLPGWRQRLSERFGFSLPAAPGNGIVVHAASVGEVNAAAGLIEALLKRYPKKPVIVSCVTPTGSDRIKALFGARVTHAYIPLDLAGATRRWLNHFKPTLLVVMETEIWPNLYANAQTQGSRIIIANARISDRSLKGYSRFSALTGATLARVDKVLAQSPADAERFLVLGAASNQTLVSGNLKFDQTAAATHAATVAYRERWGTGRPVFIAASTHAADDLVLRDAFTGIRKRVPDAMFIVVPRHPERFGQATELMREAGFETQAFSTLDDVSDTTQVLVVDAMGQLMGFYAVSDVAFVGGSFGDSAGHNTLEAAAHGLPVLIGPHTADFRDINQQLLQAGGAKVVTNADALAALVSALLTDAEQRADMGAAAFACLDKGKGALKRTLSVIDQQLSGSR